MSNLERYSQKVMWGQTVHEEEDGGRGFIGEEQCIGEEERSLSFYVDNSGEILIRGVATAGKNGTEGIITSGEFKKQREQELKQK